MPKKIVNSTGENGEPQLDFLERAIQMLQEAENMGFHHCPAQTVEAVHYDRIIALIKALEG